MRNAKKHMLALKSDQIWQQIAHFNGPKDVRVGDRMEDGAKEHLDLDFLNEMNIIYSTVR